MRKNCYKQSEQDGTAEQEEQTSASAKNKFRNKINL